jgi:hypothetical protein
MTHQDSVELQRQMDREEAAALLNVAAARVRKLAHQTQSGVGSQVTRQHLMQQIEDALANAKRLT